MSTELIIVGLVFGMIGTILMALQSIKNPIRYDNGRGASFGFLFKEDPNYLDPKVVSRRVWTQRLGLGFIGFAFLLQLIGTLQTPIN